MLLYMLDTDIASYIMKRASPKALAAIQAIPPAAVAISAIAVSELAFGVEKSPNRQRDLIAIEDFLRRILVLDYPAVAAQHYGQIRAELKMRGTPIGANDMLIAAHARCLNLTLVTNNTREFARVPGLKIENWA